MIRPLIRTIILNTLFLLLTIPAADAAVPVPSDVPEDLVEPQRTELSAEKEELLSRRDSIKLRVAIHNAKCGRIRTDSDIVDECKADQKKLRAEISSYADDVTAFNALVVEAPKVLDEPGPDSMPADNIIKYFLVNREESYTIHSALLRDMNADITHDSLLNPNDETQELRDKELPGPLDLEKTNDLTLDQAAQLVHERQDARERQATRKAAEKMHKEEIISDITKQEIADVRKARSLALWEMEEIIKTRVPPAEKEKFVQTKEKIRGRLDSDLKRINSRSMEYMSEEMERLKHEGYYREGDDLIEKDRNDPAFRSAVNEAVRNVLIRRYEAEHRVHQKALNDMRSAAGELLKMKQ